MPRLSAVALALVMLLIAVPLPRVQAAETIIYSWPATLQQDPRSYYPIALLRLALAKAGGDYELKPSKRDQSQRRSLRQLAAGLGMDVVWTFTSIEREKNLLPIRIPIDRGLLGWLAAGARRGSKQV